MRKKTVIDTRIFYLGQGLPVRVGNRAFSFCSRALRRGGLALFYLTGKDGDKNG